MHNSYPVFFELDLHMVHMLLLACIVLIILVLSPRLKASKYITSPAFFLISGVLVFLLPIQWELPDLIEEAELLKRITELGVIIALASAGLKINEPFLWKTWSASSRLLIVTMPLTIIFTALLGWWAGLVPASAILLGAAIAPTDPVLADDVQTSDPGDSDSSPTRLALTTEAGLNDGLAFPFTNLAIAVAVLGLDPGEWFINWLVIDVLYKIIIGFAIGILSGKILAFLLFKMTEKQHLKIAEGVFSITLVLFPYAVAELVSTYGFIAVFIAACYFRQQEPEHQDPIKIHQFSITMERIFEGVLMLMVGGYIAFGALSHLTPLMIMISVLVILIVRPFSGWVALVGSDLPNPERWAVAFYGIRGIGSLYYLSYAIYRADFPQSEELWAMVIFIIAVSVFLHGISAKYVMDALDRWRR